MACSQAMPKMAGQPKMADVPAAERNDLLKEKLATCAVVYDFAEAETPERDQKRQILLGEPLQPFAAPFAVSFAVSFAALPSSAAEIGGWGSQPSSGVHRCPGNAPAACPSRHGRLAGC